MSQLTDALRALAAGEEDRALELLIEAWREARASELAELVELLSQRLARATPKLDGKLEVFQARWLAVARRRHAVDLPRLLDSILHTTQRSGVAIVAALAERGAALAGWPADPRTAAGIAAHLNARSFAAMSQSNQPFWRAAFQLVRDHADPSAIEVFGKLRFAMMFRGWNDVAKRIAFFQPAVDGVVAELRARYPAGPPKLPRALAKDVTKLRAAIAARGAIAPALATRLAADPAPPTPRSKPITSAAPAPGPRDPEAAAATRAHLDAAGAALAQDDDERALAALLDAWRATRAPRIGELIDAISARIEPRLSPLAADKREQLQRAWLAVAKQRRPADLPRLLASLTDTAYRATDALTRLRALASWPADPRAASGALHQLAHIKFHTSSTRPFWSALIAFAVAHGDVRTAAAAEALVPRLGKILHAKYTDMTATRTWFRNQITAAAAQLRAQFPDGEPALDAATLASCDRIAAQIRELADAGGRLLAEIAAAPEDDRPRQVLGDLLQERGDPRGELITLQLAGDRSPAVEARIAELVAMHGKAWLGPLAAIAYLPLCRFERGFPVEIFAYDDGRSDAIERVVGHPIWATVRRLWVPDDELPGPLLRHPVMRSLVHLGALGAAPLRELLAWDRVPYRSLGLTGDFTPADRRAVLAEAGKLDGLRALELDGTYFAAGDVGWLLGSAIGARLDQLDVISHRDSLADWLAAIDGLAVRSLRVYHRAPWAGQLELVRDAERRFSIARVQIGGAPGQRTTNGSQLSYAIVVRLLEELPAKLLAQLVIRGQPPTDPQRRRLERACERFPGIAVELPDAAPRAVAQRRRTQKAGR